MNDLRKVDEVSSDGASVEMTLHTKVSSLRIRFTPELADILVLSLLQGFEAGTPKTENHASATTSSLGAGELIPVSGIEVMHAGEDSLAIVFRFGAYALAFELPRSETLEFGRELVHVASELRPASSSLQ